MKNVVSKIFILAVAVAGAIGSVLFFIKYVVNPPEDISAIATVEEVFNPCIKNTVASFNPDSHNLKEAEVLYDALVDLVNIFNEDGLIIDKNIYNDAIEESSDKFARYFTSWSSDEFKKSIWNTGNHDVMLRLISKLRNVSINDGSMKALSSGALSSLTEIESIIKGYREAMSVVNSASRCTSVSEIKTIVEKANKYKHEPYTNNTRLINALNRVGDDAKEAVVSYIVRTGSNVVYNRRSYKDYTEWTSYYYNVEKLIEEFRNAGYGYPTDLSYIHNSLIEADKEMLAFYSERERIRGRSH